MFRSTKVHLKPPAAKRRHGSRRRPAWGGGDGHGASAQLSSPAGDKNVPHDLAVDGARDAVLQLQVHLGHRVLLEDGGIRNVACRGVSKERKVLMSGGPNARMAADSTMLRMVNRLMALSLGVQREQLLQRMGFTWPRPFLLRPLFFLFLTMVGDVLVVVSD
jgi:hypothetical protein